jgi:hypothetical protein
MFVLEITGKHAFAPSMKLLNSINPIALTMRIKPTARTSYHRKILRNQFIRGEIIFFHIGFTVSVVLGEMSTAYYPTMIAANAAADKIDALVAIKSLTARSKALSLSRVAHKH